MGIRSRPVSRSHVGSPGNHWILIFAASGRAKAKIKRFGDDIIAVSPEYDDCRRLALETTCPFMKFRGLLKSKPGVTWQNKTKNKIYS